MTRQEQSGTRDLQFSGWIRHNLPDSGKGYLVTDIDFNIFNYKTKDRMLIEVKQHGSQMQTWQRREYEDLARWIGQGCEKDGWHWHGAHVIVFEGTNCQDGKIFLDGKAVTEAELIKFLSFQGI